MTAFVSLVLLALALVLLILYQHRCATSSQGTFCGCQLQQTAHSSQSGMFSDEAAVSLPFLASQYPSLSCHQNLMMNDAFSSYGLCSFCCALLSFPFATSGLLLLCCSTTDPVSMQHAKPRYASAALYVYSSTLACGQHCTAPPCTQAQTLTSTPAPACAAASSRAPHPRHLALCSVLDCNCSD